MITIISVITSVKDYVEVVHQLINAELGPTGMIPQYDEFGPLITYIFLSLKTIFSNLFSFNWLKNIGNLTIIIPDISSSLLSEISILEGSFNNIFNFTIFEDYYGENNIIIASLQKFSIGLINSLFLWLPTSTAHIIALRRFVMQGLEAGYIAGLGTLTGTILWITCIIFGCRFIVIPWLSLDIFRYVLGFIILVKYMWDSYNERRMILEDLSKQKIFLLNFLLALTEQTSIYPFVSNLSIGAESSIIESFPATNYGEFLSIHGWYIGGLIVGGFSLLNFTCWFIESYAFNIYMWFIGSFKVSAGFYYKIFNFFFLYLIMFCAISSIPYYGLDYTLTKPLGFIPEDRIVNQRILAETSFLNGKASDRNTRKNRGRHGRREKWKRRVRQYRTFDVSLYGQGNYDLFTIEDLNYGFDKFWLRRKMRNHRVRFRFFPGKIMRSFKKELSKTRLESYSGPRQEFFRVLFEQVYEPVFHDYKKTNKLISNQTLLKNDSAATLQLAQIQNQISQENPLNSDKLQDIQSQSMLRKFIRKTHARIKGSEIKNELKPFNKGFNKNEKTRMLNKNTNMLFSKRWKEIFSKLDHEKGNLKNRKINTSFANFSNQLGENTFFVKFSNPSGENKLPKNYQDLISPIKNLKKTGLIRKESSRENISKKDQDILIYRSLLFEPTTSNSFRNSPQNNNSFSKKRIKNPQQLSKQFENNVNSKVLLHPIKFYLQKQQAFERKLRYYTPTVFRKFSQANNPAYFRVLMKRFFYYYKPDGRWERTMKVATLRKALRKTKRIPKIIPGNFNKQINPASPNTNLAMLNLNPSEQLSNLSTSIAISLANSDQIQQPSHNYSVVGKRISRYRYQIYKDVLQHWYYSPMNRILLKFDIDSFIKRQPKTHFLTKNEEGLLHIRRFLLSEHYNTLRWYTSMEHYRSMKMKIGGTKSFASRSYNQQFQGTFKKIRHLFSITPSQVNQNEINAPFALINQLNLNANSKSSKLKIQEPTVLKFDQPLINDSLINSSTQIEAKIIFHEELLTKPLNGSDILGKISQSLNQKEFDKKSLQNQKINEALENQDYLNTTKLLFPNLKSKTSEKPFLINESVNATERPKNLAMLNLLETNEVALKDFMKEKFNFKFKQELYLKLLKHWKRKVTNLKSLRFYLKRKKSLRRIKKTTKNLSFTNTLSKFTEAEQTNLNFKITDHSELYYDVTVGLHSALIASLKTITEIQPFTNLLPDLKNTSLFHTKLESEVLLKEEKKLQTSLDILHQTVPKMNSTLKLKNYKNRLFSFFNASPEKSFFKKKQKLLKNWKHKRLSKKYFSRLRKELKKLKKKLPNRINEKKKVEKLTFTNDKTANKFNMELDEKETQEKINQSVFKQFLEKILSLEQNISSSKKEKQEIYNDVLKLVGRNRFFAAWAKGFEKRNPEAYQLQVNFTGSELVQGQEPQQYKIDMSFNPRVYKIDEALLCKTFMQSQKLEDREARVRIANELASKMAENERHRVRTTEFLTNQNENGTHRENEAGPSEESSLVLGITRVIIAEQLAHTVAKNEQLVEASILSSPSSFSSLINSSSYTDLGSFINSSSYTDLVRSLMNSSTDKPSSSNPSTFPMNSITDQPSSYTDLLMNSITDQPSSSNPVTFPMNSIDFKEMNSQIQENKTKKILNVLKSSLQSNSEETRRRVNSPSFFKEYSKFLSKFWKLNKPKNRRIRRISRPFILPSAPYLKKVSPSQIDELVKSKINILPDQKDNLFEIIKKRNPISNKSTTETFYNNRGNVKKTDLFSRKAVPYRQLQVKGNHDVFQQRKDALRMQKQVYGKLKNYMRCKFVNLNIALKKIKLESEFNTWWFKKILPRLKANSYNPNSINFGEPDFDSLKGLNEIKYWGFFSEFWNQKNLKEKDLIIFPKNQQNETISQNFNDLMLNLYDVSLPVEKTLNMKISLLPKIEFKSMESSKDSTNLINQLSKNKILENELEPQPFLNDKNSEFRVNTNPIPFYVGWDESLRQFIVTNRFLSRRESGYSFIKNQEPSSINDSIGNSRNLKGFEDFTLSPSKGLNALTTVNTITPFSTYTSDQFFVMGLDAYAPLNWRKFKFRHTILKKWLYENNLSTINTNSSNQNNNPSMQSLLIKKKTNRLAKEKTNAELNKNLLYKIKEKNYPNLKISNEKIQMSKLMDNQNKYRRLQKRYRRVKNHPREPVFFPSGSLVHEVLPIHYISVFYKRSRLPRDRYLKRKLDNKKMNFSNSQNQFSSLDFTLRKRVKPSREYHNQTNPIKKSTIIPVIPGSLSENNWGFRPFSSHLGRLLSADLLRSVISNKKSLDEAVKEYLLRVDDPRSLLKKQTKQGTSSARVKRLRRRTLRQTIRPETTYSPQSGGIFWPGDYLQNELMQAPVLDNKPTIPLNNKNSSESLLVNETRKIEKTKNNLPFINRDTQPKRYLLEKHNKKVIKKKLEKVYRSHQL